MNKSKLYQRAIDIFNRSVDPDISQGGGSGGSGNVVIFDLWWDDEEDVGRASCTVKELNDMIDSGKIIVFRGRYFDGERPDIREEYLYYPNNIRNTGFPGPEFPGNHVDWSDTEHGIVFSNVTCRGGRYNGALDGRFVVICGNGTSENDPATWWNDNIYIPAQNFTFEGRHNTGSSVDVSEYDPFDVEIYISEQKAGATLVLDSQTLSQRLDLSFAGWRGGNSFELGSTAMFTAITPTSTNNGGVLYAVLVKLGADDVLTGTLYQIALT